MCIYIYIYIYTCVYIYIYICIYIYIYICIGYNPPGLRPPVRAIPGSAYRRRSLPRMCTEADPKRGIWTTGNFQMTQTCCFVVGSSFSDPEPDRAGPNRNRTESDRDLSGTELDYTDTGRGPTPHWAEPEKWGWNEPCWYVARSSLDPCKTCAECNFKHAKNLEAKTVREGDLLRCLRMGWLDQVYVYSHHNVSSTRRLDLGTV